jgi:hypothetical protein
VTANRSQRGIACEKPTANQTLAYAKKCTQLEFCTLTEPMGPRRRSEHRNSKTFAARSLLRNLTRAQQLFLGGITRKTAMRTNTIALATAFALSSTLAFAQAGGNTAGGSSAAGGPAASQTTTGDSKDGGTTSGGGNATKEGAAGATTGSSTPSAKDASTQGAGTAGSVERKGDATTPGGTMKK